MGIVAKNTMYLNADKSEVLEATYEKDDNGVEQEIAPEGAAFLLARKGAVVDAEFVQQYDIAGDDEMGMERPEYRKELMEQQYKVAMSRQAYGEAAALRVEMDNLDAQMEHADSTADAPKAPARPKAARASVTEPVTETTPA
jgi:hypothetical protein